jgi:hypothetical protein
VASKVPGRASGRSPRGGPRAGAIRGGAVSSPMDEDVVDRGRVADEGDDAHLGAAERAHQGEDFIDAGEQQRPGVAGSVAMGRFGGG